LEFVIFTSSELQNTRSKWF